MATRQSSSLSVPSQPARDARWFAALSAIDRSTPILGLSRELFTVLGPDHQQLEQFRRTFSKIPFNPDLRPRHFDIKLLDRPLTKLAALRDDIETNETDAAIRQAYLAKLDEVRWHNVMMIAAASHDQAGFTEANKQLYGQPDRTVFAAECDWLRKYSDEYVDSPNRYLRQCARNLQSSLPLAKGNSQYIFPGNAVFKRVRQLHVGAGAYYEQLIGSEVLPDYVTAEIGDPVVRRAIRTVGADYTLADSSDGLWGIVHHARLVVRPASYRLSREDFTGIVAHEIGSHLLERCNGSNQPLRLLKIGLDRYEAGNEGRAFMREQLVYNTPYAMQRQSGWEYIILKHLAISLAYGLDGAPMSFRDLYDRMYVVCRFFQALRQSDNPVIADTTAHYETWQLLVRVLKGTDGYGGAYLKDIVYLEGNVRAWRVAARNPALVRFGDNGKFDIARQEHRHILAATGLRPARDRKLNLRRPDVRQFLRRHS